MNAKPQSIFYLAGFCIAAIFALSAMWEFWLEDFVDLYLLEELNNETVTDHWHVVLATTLISAAAWAICMPLYFKIMSRASQAEQAADQFRSTLDQTLDCVFILRIDTLKFLYVNQSAAEQSGYTREELMRMTPADINPAYGNAEFREILARLKNGSCRSYDFETVFRHKDGTWLPFDVSLQYVTPPGEIPRFVAIARDITKRKKAEEELQRSERRFRAIVDNSPAKIHIKDLQGRYLLVNPQAEKLFKVTEAEARGKTTEEIFRKKLADSFKAHDQAVLESGCAIEREEEWIEDDGPHTYLTVKFPILNHAGAMTGIGAIGTDITERKKIQAQLSQSQKMESLGSLAGGIAHDLNNTLVPAIGLTELVLEDLPPGSPARAHLERVLGACDRAKKLVAQILAFSRHTPSDNKPIELGGVIRETLSLLRAALPMTVEIHEDIEEGMAPIEADPTKIHQILMNLGSNARHAMGLKAGVLSVILKQVEVTRDLVKIHPELIPGPHARLTVGDTGSGMDQATLGQIFDPFFTTKVVGSGTGMGLAVVHGIVKSHGGTIAVSSEPEKGTVFEIYLPLQNSRQARRKTRHAAE